MRNNVRITNRIDGINCLTVINNAIDILNGTKKFGEITLLSNCIHPSLTVYKYMHYVLDNWIMYFDRIDESERAVRLKELHERKESLMEFLEQ